MEARAWVTGTNNQSQTLLHCTTGSNTLLTQTYIICHLKAFSLQLGANLSRTLVV